ILSVQKQITFVGISSRIQISSIDRSTVPHDIRITGLVYEISPTIVCFKIHPADKSVLQRKEHIIAAIRVGCENVGKLERGAWLYAHRITEFSFIAKLIDHLDPVTTCKSFAAAMVGIVFVNYKQGLIIGDIDE